MFIHIDINIDLINVNQGSNFQVAIVNQVQMLKFQFPLAPGR